MANKTTKRVVKKINQKKSLADRILSFSLKPALSYLNKIKIYILITVILFFLSSVFGYFNIIGKISPELSNSLNQQIIKSVEEIVKQTENLGPLELVAFIMTNNIKTAFFGVVFGIFFAIFPLVIVLFNGYVLGFVAYNAVNSPINEIGIFILWRLFPHGIFEIPAILIGIALGIRIGTFPFYIKDKAKGFLALLLSLIIFIFSFGLIFSIFNFIINPGQASLENVRGAEAIYSNIFNSPLLSFIFILVLALCFIVSILVGLNIISYSDRKIVYENLINTAKAFVFIIIPLLVIAGIIEGLLIAVVG